MDPKPGNSPSALRNKLLELHNEEWQRKQVCYLSDCLTFQQPEGSTSASSCLQGAPHHHRQHPEGPCDTANFEVCTWIYLLRELSSPPGQLCAWKLHWCHQFSGLPPGWHHQVEFGSCYSSCATSHHRNPQDFQLPAPEPSQPTEPVHPWRSGLLPLPATITVYWWTVWGGVQYLYHQSGRSLITTGYGFCWCQGHRPASGYHSSGPGWRPHHRGSTSRSWQWWRGGNEYV